MDVAHVGYFTNFCMHVVKIIIRYFYFIDMTFNYQENIYSKIFQEIAPPSLQTECESCQSNDLNPTAFTVGSSE